MIQKNLRIFLDTSVVFAAVLSPTGGARALFLLAEAGILKPVVAPTVLKECDEVIRRKAPGSLPILAQLLAAAHVETSAAATRDQITMAQSYIRYAPDARVLAEAIHAKPDWFATHDKEHFLKSRGKIHLPFEIGTPGDLIQRLKDDFSLH
ncbi:MAG: PIN domain-containing protein [Chloroflexi bacterium]|nr:PIN domain-containing protein [Chloroflexota bacterium]